MVGKENAQTEKRVENADERVETLQRKISDLERHREYVKNVADELRNPLQILRGYLELWDRETLSGAEKEFFDKILKETGELERGIKKITEGE